MSTRFKAALTWIFSIRLNMSNDNRMKSTIIKAKVNAQYCSFTSQQVISSERLSMKNKLFPL